MTSKVVYKGALRTEAIHIRSGNKIITDAPIDNKGKGEAFSPTDLVATALTSCMLTIIGIKAENMEINIEGATAELEKTMDIDPRRIKQLDILIKIPIKVNEKAKKILEKAAITCPVVNSLSNDIEIKSSFNWVE